MAFRTAGAWLVVGAVVWVVALVFHPPPPPEVSAFMQLIADTGTRWVVVHWGAAFALSVFVVASLILLTARTRLTASPLGLSAWALLPVGALWVLTTAVSEATVIAQAAAAGDEAMFSAWHGFAEGKGMGFMGIALAVAGIAAGEARSAQAVTPRWAAWVAVAAGLAGSLGWLLGPVLGIAAGGPMFVVGSVVFGLWVLWFAVGLVRSGAPSGSTQARPEAEASR